MLVIILPVLIELFNAMLVSVGMDILVFVLHLHARR